jgi:hypothetical protein
MNVKANLAINDHDIRLNMFLGVANWYLFLDHIPNNVANWVTARNFGFSGAADWFIFITGYTSAVIFAKIMLERGFIVGATRVFRRVWQLYAAYVVLFTIYLVAISYVAAEYAAPDLINDFNISALFDHPLRILIRSLFLQPKALNLDVLQLYTALTIALAPILWLMLRLPNLTMAASVALYFTARHFDWNLSSFPDGTWYFNPFCWQLLFVFGARLALGRAPDTYPVLRSPLWLYLAFAYLLFALVVTLAGRFPSLGITFPEWLIDTVNPNDKVNLAPFRVLHFAAAVFVTARFIPKDWPGLRWPVFDPLIKCGEESLAVFCVGVFLSFIGHFALIVSSGSVIMQLLVSAAGIVVMTIVAYYISWSKQQDVWKNLARA